MKVLPAPITQPCWSLPMPIHNQCCCCLSTVEDRAINSLRKSSREPGKSWTRSILKFHLELRNWELPLTTDRPPGIFVLKHVATIRTGKKKKTQRRRQSVCRLRLFTSLRGVLGHPTKGQTICVARPYVEIIN